MYLSSIRCTCSDALPCFTAPLSGVHSQAMGLHWPVLPPPAQLDQRVLLFQERIRAAGPAQDGGGEAACHKFAVLPANRVCTAS